MGKQLNEVGVPDGTVPAEKNGVLLPVRAIAGFPFLVDVFNKVIWDAKAADNFIYFHEMKDIGYCYEFTLNRGIRNLPTSWSDPSQDVIVQIPQMVDIDPPAVAKKYNVAVKDLPIRDSELKCDPALLSERLKGVLPTIEIAGDEFSIDLLSKQLLKTGQGRARLNMRQMAETSDGISFEFHYHLTTRSIVTVSTESTKLPSDVVLVRIPREEMLDPVGFARSHKLKVNEFVNEYPLQKKLKATIIPLWKTPLAAIIRDNNKKAKKLPGQKRRA